MVSFAFWSKSMASAHSLSDNGDREVRNSSPERDSSSVRSNRNRNRNIRGHEDSSSSSERNSSPVRSNCNRSRNRTRSNNNLRVADRAPSTFSQQISVKLESKNFLSWKQQVEGVIRGHKLQRFVINPTIPPRYLTTRDRDTNSVNPVYSEWE